MHERLDVTVFDKGLKLESLYLETLLTMWIHSVMISGYRTFFTFNSVVNYYPTAHIVFGDDDNGGLVEWKSAPVSFL